MLAYLRWHVLQLVIESRRGLKNAPTGGCQTLGQHKVLNYFSWWGVIDVMMMMIKGEEERREKKIILNCTCWWAASRDSKMQIIIFLGFLAVRCASAK